MKDFFSICILTFQGEKNVFFQSCLEYWDIYQCSSYSLFEDSEIYNRCKCNRGLCASTNEVSFSRFLITCIVDKCKDGYRDPVKVW